VAWTLQQTPSGQARTSSGPSVTATCTSSTQGTTLIAVLGSSSTGGVWSAPSGWLAALSKTGTNCECSIWYYPNNPGGITSVVFSNSAGTATLSAAIAEFNPNGAGMYPNQSGSGATTGAQDIVVTTGGSPASGDLGICIFNFVLSTAATVTWTTPSGWTLIGDNTASAIDHAAGYYYIGVPSSGTLSVEGEVATTQTDLVGEVVTFSLVPAASGTAAVSLTATGVAEHIGTAAVSLAGSGTGVHHGTGAASAAVSLVAGAIVPLPVGGTTSPSIPEAIPAPVQTSEPGPGEPGGPGGPGGSAAPGQGSGYEIAIRAAPEYSTLMTLLPRYESLQFTKMLNDKGSGSVVQNLDDPWFADSTLALPAPGAPVVIAQGSSDATADVFTADVQTAAAQGSAVTVVSSASGSNTPVTCGDTEGNLYLNTLANLLSSNPYFEQSGAGSVADWSAFNCTLTSLALSGLPVPYGALLTVTTAGCACEGSPAKFTITPGASYLVTALVWLPEAGTVVLGADWNTSGGGYVSTSTSSISVAAETWTAIGTVVTAPGSGVGKAYPRCGYGSGTGVGTTMQLTALGMQLAASMQVFQALNITALTLNDAISVTYAADDAQQTNLIALNVSGIVPAEALDVIEAAAGTSASATVSGTPAQIGELGLFFVNNAGAGGAPGTPSGWSQLAQIAGTGGGGGQRMLIGLYSYPPSGFWTAAIDAAPTTAIIIANVDSGPGDGQESNFLAVYQEAAAAGITLAGYVSTNYGAESQTALQNQIQQWNDYYGITSIFFDTVNTAADYVDYYQALVEYVHAQPGGDDAIVILNPGSPPVQALFGVIGENDIIQVCEDSYANFAGDGATAPAWLFDESSSNIAVTVNQCPNSTDMATALGIASSDFNAGFVWITADADYSAEPSYFSAEVTALEGTGTTEQYTTVFYTDVTSTSELSPAAALTSAAWQVQLLTLEGTSSASASTLWDDEHLWQVILDGVVVFEFFSETITEQLIDQSEQRNITVTGPGTITALSWAAAMPPGFPDIIFKCDALQDGFAEIDENGNLEVDTSLWNVISPTDMVTLNPSGTLQLTASTDTTYCGATPYDLTESLISAQIAPLGQGTENSTDITVALDGSQVSQFYVQSNSNADDYILMGVTADGLYCQLGDSAGGPQTKQLGAYNNQTQLYWQLSAQYLDADSGAVQVTFWTSADGQTYTPVWVVNPTWVPDNVTVFFACSYDANNSEVMSITNLNGNVVTPSSSGNIYFGEPIMAVWDSIFTAAQERGTIPFITTALTGATDSFGNPWTDSESVQIENGTDLYSLLQSHTAIVDADYIMQPGFVLQVGLPAEGSITLGVDRSQQVVFRDGQWIQQKQYTRDRSQIANLDGAVNSDGTTISASDEDSILEWGQREGWVQTAVQVNPQSMEIAAQASVQQTADEIESYTIQVDPAQPGCRAWKDYNVGDWIGLEQSGALPAAESQFAPALVGAFFSKAEMDVSFFDQASALWETWTGVNVPVTRLYLGMGTSLTTDMREMAAAGVKVCVDWTAPYNPVSATFYAELESLLQQMVAIGLNADVCIWHEPYYGGLTAAQYVAAVQYYGPMMRRYYPLVCCFSGPDADLSNGYYPGDAWCDKITVDQYAYGGNETDNSLTNAAAIADAASPPKPLGLWEFNSSTDANYGQNEGEAQAFFNYVTSFFSDRLVAGLPNADIILFDSGGQEGGGVAGAGFNWLGPSTAQNASFEGGVGSWSAYSGCSVAETSAQAHSGSDSLAVTATGTSNMLAVCWGASGYTSGLPVTAGDTVVLSAWFRASTVSRNCQPTVQWYNSSGSLLSSSFGSATADTTTGWTQVSGTSFTAPANAAYALPVAEIQAPAGSGEVHYVDDVYFYVSASAAELVTAIQFPWDYRLAMWKQVYYALNSAPVQAPVVPDFSFASVDAVRVTAIAISVDATGLVTCQLTLITYLQWLQEQLQYLVNKMGGQFINSLGTTPVTSSANGVPTQLPTIFAPNINGLNGANVLGTTGIPMGSQLVYNSITGQWQAASSQDAETGATLAPTGANLSTLQYSTPQASQGNLIASISNSGGTDATGNTYLPGVVSYGSTPSETIQLYMGQVQIGQAPGTQIVLNPTADQVFNITTAIAGTLQAIAEFTTNDTNEVLPGIAGSLVLNPGASQKMASALTSPMNANSAACVVLETENDAGTDTPVITFGQVSTPDDSTFVFTPIATLTPWAFLLYGGEGGTVVETIDGPSSGNWPVPATVSVVKAEVWGMSAGAGGSNHSFWTVQAGGGSGGGGYSCEPALAVTPGGNCPYVLPAGGAGGVGSTGSPGGAADATFQGSAATVTAHGGLPGAGAASPGNGQGGDGAAASGNTISYPGGQGATGGYNDGGGGGGAAGTGGPGGGGAINGGGSPGSGGGKGGDGGLSGGPGNGSNGSSPGGGAGGGAGTSASGTVDGGSGGAARARVTYTTGAPDIMASFAAAAGTDQFGNPYPEGSVLAGADAGWTYVGTGGAPGFGAGWSNAGSGNAEMAYKNLGQNTVLLVGVVNNGTGSNTASIFTLPTAYRPADQQVFSLVEGGATYGNSLVVQTNGAVKLFNAAGAGTYYISALVSLDV
jgi:Spherulation-specific family 4/Carbohydrate binding domain